MLENLAIALRRQRKLIVIFLLTIFLPALTLGVFGIRAIRNERFRLAKQEENEARRVTRFIKGYVQGKLETTARTLAEMAREPALLAKDLKAVGELTRKRISSDPLAGQAVLLYRNEAPFLPLMQVPEEKNRAGSPGAGDASLAERTRQAEALEFVDKNYLAAAAIYRDLSTLAAGKNIQAEMLVRQARCFQKAEDFREAVRAYTRIVNEYPDSLTSSGLRLSLLARLQAVVCFRLLGDARSAARSALDAFGELLKAPSALSEEQFKTYASLAGEALDSLLRDEKGSRIPEELHREYADLKEAREARVKEWEAVGLLRREVVSELERRLSQSTAYDPEPYRFSRMVEGRDLLFLAVWIPERDADGVAGVFGVQLDDRHLSGEVHGDALAGTELNEDWEVVLADVSGRPLTEKRSLAPAVPLATEFFEDNFPPWRVELFQVRTQGPGILDLRKNFYFWTILTLVVVLAFGALLLARTIAHEMEILKIKSDFVSSVSHEFKTPLTSIRALMERLVDGKVRDPGKMDQYFALISQDTDKLTRLVNNLLDFSKIEEGKKEYAFADADLVRIAAEQVESFRKEQVQAGPEIRLEVAGGVPTLRADADALSRALANLLSNAVKFTPPGKSIRVGVRSDERNVILEVEDQGIGIHPDEVDKVFEKFFQGRNAPGRSVRGTGLGLTLVKHIVEAHGGRALVESRVGLGSKFSLVLPLKS